MTTKCSNPDLMTPEELAEVYALLPDIRNWLNAVEAEALRLTSEDRLPGYKLVGGRSLRKWNNEDEAETMLSMAGFAEEELYSKSFVSVAQAEKLIGKATFRKLEAALVYRTEGKPVVAPLSDKRTPINAGTEFETVKPEEGN